MDSKRIGLALLGILALACGIVGFLLLLEGLQTAKDFHREGLLTIEHANRVIIVAGGTIANIEKASREAEAASKEQRAYWRAISQKTNKALTDADGAILDTRVVLSRLDGTISHLDVSLASVASDSSASVRKIGDTVAALQPAIAKLTETADNAARITSSPHITATLDNIAEATHEMAGVAADAHEESTLLVGATRKALTPRGKLSAIFHGILSGTLTVAELAYYLSH